MSCTRDIKEFLIKNKRFLFQVIKNIDPQEINKIVDYPYIIIDPIKKFKRKMKKKLKNTKNLNTKNTFNNITKRNKNYKRMNTITIHSNCVHFAAELTL